MVGREGELARLEAALSDAAGGHGRTVVIGGEAGIGKTRLVSAAAGSAQHRQFSVLTGASLPAGSGVVPFEPFVESLRRLLRSVEPGRLQGLLGPARDEIGRLLPELSRAERRGDIGEGDRAGSSRLFEAVLTVIERLAAQSPVFIAIEDVQWADEGTLGLLSYLSRNLREAPIVLVVTVRTDDLDPGTPVGHWLAEVDLDEWVDRFELEPLTPGQVVALIRAMPGARVDGDALDAMVERSGGNPFFVEQLAATHEDPGSGLPRRLRDVLTSRLADLPEQTTNVLRGASAAGRRVDDSLLAAVLHLSPDGVAGALRPAIASGILVEVPGTDGRPIGYAFRHALLAEVAYDTLLLGERLRLHAAFGQELERRGEIGGQPVTPAELAHHWVAARDATRAIPALMQAGLDAERVYAFLEALRHYESALELWQASGGSPTGIDRIDMLQRAAECAVLSGAYSRAVELGREAIAAAEADRDANGAPDPVRLGTLHDRLRWFLWEAGDRAAAETAVEEALRLIPASPPTATRARTIGQAAKLRLFTGDVAGAGRLAREAVDVARAADATSEEAFATGILGWSEALTGDVAAGVATYRAALATAERLGGVEGIALGHANLAALFERVGRAEEALAAAVEGYEVAARLGVARTYGGVLLATAARAQFDLGRWADGVASITKGLDLDPGGPAASSLHVASARLAIAQGRLDDAEAQLRLVAGDLPSPADARDQLLYAAAVLELEASRGRLPSLRAAIDTLWSASGAPAIIDPDTCWATWAALRAEADAAASARARADSAASDEIETRAARVGGLLDRTSRIAPDDSYLMAVVGLCRAEMRRLEGRSDPDVWSAQADRWEDMGRPAAASYGHYRTAEAIIGRRGDRSVSARHLRMAFDIAARLGAEPLREEIARLARNARIRVDQERGPESATAADPLGLTDREAEVIRLVAAGRSNQQIADELFITRKTASVHVSNILGKLGVANRVEAAAVAHRLGLGPDDMGG
jgi:DNA-binding CsgD family transcriptional regulator